MNKNASIVFFMVMVTVSALGQSNDEYKRAEVFVGYSAGIVENEFPDTDPLFGTNRYTTFHGFNTSAAVNLSRYVGLKADVSGAYKNQNVNINTPDGALRFDADQSLYNFLGGIQIKDNSTDTKFKPFVHALVGAGHLRVDVRNTSCPVGIDCSFITGRGSSTGFAGAFGGGVDVKLNNHIDLRLVQVDYNPVRIEGTTMQNVRFGIGLVFR